MISQKHDDDLQQGEQSVSAVGEKQTTVSEGRSQQTPALPRRWIVVMSILGVAMPLVTGSIDWIEVAIRVYIWYEVVLFLLIAVLMAFGASLLGFAFRRWWAGLLVPVAWIVGQFVSGRTSIIEALIVLIPLGVIGGLVGNAYRRRWEKRRQTTMSDRS